MLLIAHSIAPVFLVIAIGALLRQRWLRDDSFWANLEWLVYYLLLPAMIINTLARAQLGWDSLQLMAVLAIAILAAALLMLLLKPLFKVDGTTFSSMMQGAVRANIYIGLVVAERLYGAAGLTAAAVAVVVLVPLGNIFSVATLARYGSTAVASPGRALIKLAQNPLIAACVIGTLLSLSGIGNPLLLADTLEIIARAALPLGLLAVGAGLNLNAFRRAGRAALVTAAIKLALVPALTAGLCVVFGLSGINAAIAILYNGLPTATSSYILARQLGGNAPLMASIIVLETALAAATLPLLLGLLSGLLTP